MSNYEITEVLHALSDPVRLSIVRQLAEGGETVCGRFELAVSDATRSHHLKVLREAGVTATRAEGTRRLVSLRRGELDAAFPGLLDAVLGGSVRHDEEPEDAEREERERQ